MIQKITSLFRNAMRPKTSNAPWDSISEGCVSIAIWRWTARGNRYVFGISRPMTLDDRTVYARTFGVEHLADVVDGLQGLCCRLSHQRDLPKDERLVFEAFADALNAASRIAYEIRQFG